ncbi:hypothetical protein PG996_013058 [Apiospora saccharicola]|uniref:Uncharacterized protein n=1 Tax=Apiospora saccharicola TaxID=335842 RepID=A0ABR1U4D0_9PEZI
MAGSSSQAAGSRGAPDGHPAESHTEAYRRGLGRAGSEPLEPAPGTKLPFNFSRPDKGFDPNDNSAVTNFFKFQDDHRHVLDMAGERGPTVEEQVERQVRELTRLRGQEVSEEERAVIENTLRRNAGWLESYKTEVAGANTVPIDAFNRLAHDYEKMQLEMVRDRTNYEADFIRVLAEKDDELEKLKEPNRVLEPLGQPDPNSNGFRLKFHDLAGRLAQRDREIQKLENDAKENKIDRTEIRKLTFYRDKMRDFENEVAEANDEIARLNQEVAALKDTTADPDDSKGSAADQGKVAEMEETIKKLRGEVAGLNRLSRSLAQAETDRDNCRKNFDFQKKQNQDLEKQVADLDKALSDLTKTNSDEAEKGEQETAELKAKVAELEAKLKAENEDGQGEKRKLQEEIGRLRQDRDSNGANHDREVANLRARVVELEAERAQLQREFDQIQTSDREGQQKIEKLERELSAVKVTEQGSLDALQDMSRRVEALHDDNKRIRAENQGLTSQNDELTSQNDELKRLRDATRSGVPGGTSLELTKSQVRVNALQSRVRELSAEIEKLKADRSSSQNDETELQQNSARLTQDLADANARLGEHEATIATLEAQVAENKEALEKAQADLEASEAKISDLERETNAAQSSSDELRERITTLQGQLGVAQRDLETRAARIGVLEREQREQTASLTQERDAAQRQLTEATNAQQASQAEILRLTTDLQAARDNAAALVQERDALHTQLDTATNAQQASQEEAGRLRAALEERGQTNNDALVQERNNLRTRLTDALNARANAETEMGNVRDELLTMRGELDAVGRSDRDGQAEIRRLNEHLTDINATSTARQTEIQTLEQRLADAVRDLAASKARRPKTGGGGSRTEAPAGRLPFSGGILGGPPKAEDLPQDPVALRTEAVRLQTELQRVENQHAETVEELRQSNQRDPGQQWVQHTADELARLRQDNANLRRMVDYLNGRLRGVQERAATANPQQ